MISSKLMMTIKGSEKDKLIPLKEIINHKDKNKYKDFQICLTLNDFKNRFPSINTDYVFYCKNNINGNMVYFDKSKYIYFYIPIYGEMYFNTNDKDSDNENLLKRINILETFFTEKKYSTLLDFTNSDYMKIELVKEMIDNKIINDFNIFSNVYTSVDYGFSNIPKETILKISKTKTDEQYDYINSKLKDFPDDIIIYRGEGTFSADYTNAYSWSTNINVANFFATRFSEVESKCPRIIKGIINKKDIITYFDNRNESEVLAISDNIKIENINDLYTIEDSKISKVCNEIIDYYHTFKSILNDLDFEDDIAEHGKLHSLRVLFLALIIAKLEGLKYMDIITLATACIYHDIGRIDEEEGNQHGIDSYKIYESLITENKIIKFIIEGHCEEDNIAFDKINSSDIDNKENIIKILKILKDADALDRVRFGVRGLDVNFLRCESSKKMMFVAQEVLDNLKL